MEVEVAGGKKESHFQEAIYQAGLGNGKNSHHGAVLVWKGKVISRGWNQPRNRIFKTNVCSVHAEMDCLNKHCFLC